MFTCLLWNPCESGNLLFDIALKSGGPHCYLQILWYVLHDLKLECFFVPFSRFPTRSIKPGLCFVIVVTSGLMCWILFSFFVSIWRLKLYLKVSIEVPKLVHGLSEVYRFNTSLSAWAWASACSMYLVCLKYLAIYYLLLLFYRVLCYWFAKTKSWFCPVLE